MIAFTFLLLITSFGDALCQESDKVCRAQEFSDGVACAVTDDETTLLQVQHRLQHSTNDESSFQAKSKYVNLKKEYLATGNLVQVKEDGTDGVWTKVYQTECIWKPQTGEPHLTHDAVGNIEGEEVITHMAKLSDADINALAGYLDGYSNVYMIRQRIPKNTRDLKDGFTPVHPHIYVRSNHPYDDLGYSFNFGGDKWTNVQIGRADTYSSVIDWADKNDLGIWDGSSGYRRSPGIDDHPPKDFSLWIYTGPKKPEQRKKFCRVKSTGHCPPGTELTREECSNIGAGLPETVDYLLDPRSPDHGNFGPWGDAGTWNLPETCGCYVDQNRPEKRYYNSLNGACDRPDEGEDMICHAVDGICPPEDSRGWTSHGCNPEVYNSKTGAGAYGSIYAESTTTISGAFPSRVNGYPELGLTEEECKNLGDDGIYDKWGEAGTWNLPETCGCYIDQNGGRYFNRLLGWCNRPDWGEKMICKANLHWEQHLHPLKKCREGATDEICSWR